MLMLVTRPDPRLVEIVDAAIRGGVNIVQVRGSDPEPIIAAIGERANVVVNASTCSAGFQPAAPPFASPSRSRTGSEAVSRSDGGRRLEAGATRGPAHRLEAGATRERARRLEACATRGIHLAEAAPFIEASIVGRSVHSLDAAIRAQSEGCQYVVAGTIFPSPSHPNGPVAGVTLIEEITRKVTIPVIAIGGITPANARSCIDAGARGVAVISYIMDARDPEAAARELVRACN